MDDPKPQDIDSSSESDELEKISEDLCRAINGGDKSGNASPGVPDW